MQHFSNTIVLASSPGVDLAQNMLPCVVPSPVDEPHYSKQGPKWKYNIQDMEVPNVYKQFLLSLVNNGVGFS